MKDAGLPSHQAYGAIPTVEPSEGDARERTPRTNFRRAVRLVVNTSLVFEGHHCSVKAFAGKATIPSEIANIAKNLIGSGVLSLSGGIALYADSPKASMSATLWILILGVIFGYFCLLIGKVCNMTGAVTYRDCWERSIGEKGALTVSTVNALYPLIGNLAYSVILSQTFQSLLETIGINMSRVAVLLIVTVVAILPLCLLKHLDVLAPFSVLGTAGIIMTALAMIYRSFDGSYQKGGIYYEEMSVDLQPDFGDHNQAWSTDVLAFLCMVFNSWVMHYNSPRYYTELKNASVPRYGQAVVGSFGLSAVVYVAIALAGFLTFGGHSNGYILNNYSPQDPLATLCRVAIAFSTLLSYPLCFIGLRDGVLDILEVPHSKHSSRNLEVLTVVLLSIITLIAIYVTDLGLINTVGGGTFATAIVFVFPAIMYRKAVKDLEDLAAPGQKREVVVALVLMVFGVVLGIFGVWSAVAGQ